MLTHFFYRHYSSPLILFTCLFFLSACAEKKQVAILDHVQNEYNGAVNLNERYLNHVYGQPDPASFERLKRYRYEAYQALMALRAKYDKTKPLPQEELRRVNIKINVYRSYLNALGATSATTDNLIGF